MNRQTGHKWVGLPLVRALVRRPEPALILVIMALGCFIELKTGVFLSQFNLTTAALGMVTIGIAALGEAFIMIAGEIDLSLGSLLGLSAVMAAWLSAHGVNGWIALVAGILVGSCGGLLNAIVILYAGVNSFIVTLGTMSVFAGLTLVITGGQPIAASESIAVLGGATKLGGVPVPVIDFLAIVVLSQLVLSMTLWGRRVSAVGDNREAARLAGISVISTKVLVFAVAGGLAGVAGILRSATLGTAEASAGEADLLPLIAAVVIGGVSLYGGRGSMLGVLLGAVLLAEVQNAYILLNLSAYLQEVTFGAVIVVAGVFDQLRFGRLRRGLASRHALGRGSRSHRRVEALINQRGQSGSRGE